MKKIDEIIEEFDKKFLNASAMPPTYEEIQAFLRQTLTDFKKEMVGMVKKVIVLDYKAATNSYEIAKGNDKEETLKLITEEIAQAQIEGDKTSRLTSLYNKIK